MDRPIRTGDEWTVEEANGHLTDLIEAAVSHGPQKIVLPGRDLLVVISATVSEKATGADGGSLLEAFLNSDFAAVDWPEDSPWPEQIWFREPPTFDD